MHSNKERGVSDEGNATGKEKSGASRSEVRGQFPFHAWSLGESGERARDCGPGVCFGKGAGCSIALEIRAGTQHPCALSASLFTFLLLLEKVAPPTVTGEIFDASLRSGRWDGRAPRGGPFSRGRPLRGVGGYLVQRCLRDPLPRWRSVCRGVRTWSLSRFPFPLRFLFFIHVFPRCKYIRVLK